MTLMLHLPRLYRDAGINVRLIPGWDQPHIRRNRPYVWEEDEPLGSMKHHTATPQYVPNRTKANVYAGLLEGTTLYQSGGGTPSLVIANAYPAPVSSGTGIRPLLDDYVTQDIRFVGDNDGEDRPHDWYGNRFYINTEVVLDGIGTWLDSEVWEMLVVAGAVESELFGWSAWRHVSHGQHSGRKIDLRDGRYPSHVETIYQLQEEIHELLQGATGIMTTARWASRLRPSDIHQMNAIGILLDQEVGYWVGRLDDKDWTNPEWNDLRDAVKVRGPLYGYAGQI